MARRSTARRTARATAQVGLVDQSDNPIMDTELPLLATLLYENGLPVKQLSNSEPLLVGDPEVVCLQGQAVFKLRITSLSSHRDKQRFRIQIAPQNIMLRNSEPALTVVTDAMKSVTKLAHRSGARELARESARRAPRGARAPGRRVAAARGCCVGVSATLRQLARASAPPLTAEARRARTTGTPHAARARSCQGPAAAGAGGGGRRRGRGPQAATRRRRLGAGAARAQQGHA